MSLRIAHLSDLHVLDLTGTSPLRFLNKRLTGLANLRGSRRGAHPLRIAEALASALGPEGVDADHVVITGDLSNLALPSEFARAQAVVRALGGPERVTVVPGNHDVYTAGAARKARFETYFAEWMVDLPVHEAAVAAAKAAGRAHYPFGKTIAPGVRIYGLSSAIPAPPLIAWGEVGEAQLGRLRALVAQESGLVDASGAPAAPIHTRIVLVHHNLHPRTGLAEQTARLRDRDALSATLRQINATALLHGHTHPPQQHRLAGGANATASTWVLGCGSSTWFKPDHDQVAHFNVLHVGSTGGIDAVEAQIWSQREGRFIPDNTDVLGRALASAALG